MKRTSVRTLILLVELLAVVVVHQCIMWAPPARAAMVWLDDDPNEAVDPNEAAGDPCPESIGIASRTWLDDDPNEPVDPNEAAGDPCPESTGIEARTWVDDEPEDPNTPDEETDPCPEVASGAPPVWRL
jgi:hypothetical protein